MEQVHRAERADRIDRVGDQSRAIAVASPGHAFFAVTMIGLGVVCLVHPVYASSWSSVSPKSPAYGALSVLCAAISLGTGIGLLWQRTAAIASRVLLGAFLLWIFVFRIPLVFRNPTATGAWWPLGDTSVMAGAAWVLYVWFAGARDAHRFAFATGENGLRIARTLYGLGLIPFGIAHFTYFARTVSMVPGWLPWHSAWAAFTGGAFIAAGVAIVFGVYARLAATLSAWEMGLFTVLVWIPVIAAGGADAGQWTEFIGSWVVTAAGWVVADSYRGKAWLAADRR
jgi:uncharacterized membrane protein